MRHLWKIFAASALAALVAISVLAVVLDDVPLDTPVLDAPDYLGLQYLMTLPTYSAVTNLVGALGGSAAVTNEAVLRIDGDVKGSNNVSTAVASAMTVVSNGFLRVIEVSPGRWQHRLPGEE